MSYTATLTGDSTGYVASMDAARAAIGRSRAALDAWRATTSTANATADVAVAKAKALENSHSALASKVFDLVKAYTIGHEAMTLFNEALSNARMDEARAHFEALGGSVDSLAAALKGAVSHDDITKVASLGASLGLTSEQIEVLASGARGLAHAVGIDTKSAFEGLTLGVGELREKQLKALGVTVDQKAAFDAFAKSIGTTADLLNQAGKQQAIYNVVADRLRELQRDGGDATDTAADKMERFQTKVADLADDIKGTLVPALSTAASYWTQFIDGIEKGEGIFGNLLAKLERFASLMSGYVNGVAREFVDPDVNKGAADGVEFAMGAANVTSGGGPKKRNPSAFIDPDAASKKALEFQQALNAVKFALEGAQNAANEAVDDGFAPFRKIADEGATHTNEFSAKVDELTAKFGLSTEKADAMKGAFMEATDEQERASTAAEMSKQIRSREISSYGQLSAAAEAAGYSLDVFAQQSKLLDDQLDLAAKRSAEYVDALKRENEERDFQTQIASQSSVQAQLQSLVGGLLGKTQLSQGAFDALGTGESAAAGLMTGGVGGLGTALGTAAGGPIGALVAQAVVGVGEEIAQTIGSVVATVITDKRVDTAGSGAVIGMYASTIAAGLLGGGPLGGLLAPVGAAAGALLSLSEQTKSYQKIQTGFSAVIDKLVDTLEPLWQKATPLVGLFDMLGEVLIAFERPLLGGGGDAAFRVLFETVKATGIVIGSLGYVSAAVYDGLNHVAQAAAYAFTFITTLGDATKAQAAADAVNSASISLDALGSAVGALTGLTYENAGAIGASLTQQQKTTASLAALNNQFQNLDLYKVAGALAAADQGTAAPGHVRKGQGQQHVIHHHHVRIAHAHITAPNGATLAGLRAEMIKATGANRGLFSNDDDDTN